MMEWFSSDANVAEWEDAMMAATGQSREEVRQTGGKMKRFYELMQKDAKGTLTKEDSAEFKQLNEDPDVKRGVEVQQEIQGIHAGRGQDYTVANDTRADSGQQASASSRTTAYEDIASAPKGLDAVAPLKPTFEAAANADQTTPVSSIKPVEIATANKVQVSPDNMFG